MFRVFFTFFFFFLNEIKFSFFLKGQYSKITFRTPLYLGGAPSAYWLVRATGTNRGFQGCVQSLSVNGKKIDMRPWPLGKALNGADVGECPGARLDLGVPSALGNQ